MEIIILCLELYMELCLLVRHLFQTCRPFFGRRDCVRLQGNDQVRFKHTVLSEHCTMMLLEKIRKISGYTSEWLHRFACYDPPGSKIGPPKKGPGPQTKKGMRHIILLIIVMECNTPLTRQEP